jgi:hypothetical protein
MRRTQHEGRTLANKRRMVGLTQHQLSKEADVVLSRLIFCETGRSQLTDPMSELLESVNAVRIQLYGEIERTNRKEIGDGNSGEEVEEAALASSEADARES